jgi:hypothetical protein
VGKRGFSTVALTQPPRANHSDSNPKARINGGASRDRRSSKTIDVAAGFGSISPLEGAGISLLRYEAGAKDNASG